MNDTPSERDHTPANRPVRPAPPAHEPVPDAGFETLCTHFAESPLAHGGGASVPIYQSSTFLYPDAEAFEKRNDPDTPYYEYTRVGNPTTAILEAKLARLERGTWAHVQASGMGAISAAINAPLHAGAHVVAVGRCYWPTQNYLRKYLPRFGVETTFIHNTNPQEFVDAIRPETRLIYLESPTSGFFDILDIRPITAVARERGITTIFDNSWATPYFQRPLDLGCDLVVHSATKYIGGHSDVVAGVIVGRDEALHRRVFREVELVGAVSDPFASWLLMRGLRTLGVRMEQHQRSALELARFLDEHPKVRRVRHPGLPTHPDHALGRELMTGYASLFSFELTDQSRAATNRFLDRLRLFGIGVSWGGYESLVIGGTGLSVDQERDTWLIRVHVGLESTQNLIDDVRQALED